MVKSNKAVTIFFFIGMLCLNNSAYAVDKHSQPDEVATPTDNKQTTSSKVVILYDETRKLSYRDNPSSYEDRPHRLWHEETEKDDTTAQAGNPHTLKEVKATPVPEPSFYAMLLMGIGLLMLWIKLFKKPQSNHDDLPVKESD